MLLLLVFADRMYGRVQSKLNKTVDCGALYPPNKLVHYQSFEMDFHLRINEYGFRGPQNLKKEKTKKRIACIGDSFTLGWGVEEEQAWPTLLQRRLQIDSLDVEVLNWGKGGHQPEDYLAVAKEMIPQWKPDLVIVTILQFEDLFQLALSQSLVKNKYSQKGRSWSTELAYRLFPNTWERLNAIPLDEKIDPEWEAQANRIWEQWPKDALEHFENLPDSVQQYFLSGELNPWMMDMNMRYPNWTDSLFMKEHIFDELMYDYFLKMNEIKNITSQYGGSIVFQTVPFKGMLSEADKKQLEAVGIKFNEQLAAQFDNKWNKALSNRGFSILSLESCMQSMSKRYTKSLYYNLDGHLTQTGNQAYLSCIYPVVRSRVD